ncbi:T-lymphocyte surface antigen Ly-9-like [Silurus asotus]|uniref:T-lymphocyte surface antigen Ly-9-like n=1 Tax=Silurus asotus TaxID=30991 RepID=A0AAD5B2Y4_SILAS|nr:T-lymphocyte surface antigen Ly-9-like [Silurus asotus]
MCVVTADTNTMTVYRAIGSSLDLTVNYPKESVSSVRWKFNNKQFAGYTQSHAYSQQQSQFTGRLKEENAKVGITVQDLQPQDSGMFLMLVDGTERQYPTQIFTVYIQNPITAVQIEKNQTWRVSTNSCDVNATCAAIGAESVSYLWSGYKTESGAQLQFSLSPEEGAVTLNCTATNNVSSSTARETLSCNAEQPITEIKILWIAVAGTVALLLVLAVLAAICCWWRSYKGGSVADSGTTVYADVSGETIAQNKNRSQSVTNGTTVYETVDEFRMNPEMTIYAKVTLPQHTTVSATSSSPYQKVC